MRTGGPGRSRTADLRFRKPSLYPSELRGPCGFDLIFSHWFAIWSKPSALRCPVEYGYDQVLDRIATQ